MSRSNVAHRGFAMHNKLDKGDRGWFFPSIAAHCQLRYALNTGWMDDGVLTWVLTWVQDGWGIYMGYTRVSDGWLTNEEII